MAGVTVRYAGTLVLPIYTYPIVIQTSSWNFQKPSHYALQTYARFNGTNMFTGISGTAIDAKYGPTRFVFGPQTDTLFMNVPWFSWNRKNLQVILPKSFGGSGNSAPIYHASNVVSRYVGNNQTITGNFTPQLIYTMPASGSVAYPASFSGSPMYDLDDTAYLFMLLTSNKLGVNDSSGFNILPLSSNIPAWSSSNGGGLIIPYNNTNYLLNMSSTAGGTNFWTSNFVAPTLTSWSAIYESPDGVLNFNALMNANGVQAAMDVSPYGWLFCSLNQITVGGTQFNGYGVLIAPDFSYYLLIQIIPQDAGSTTWRTGTVGQPNFKFDQNSYLFLKTVNVNNKIYYGTYQPQTTSYAFGSGIPVSSVPHNPGLYK